MKLIALAGECGGVATTSSVGPPFPVPDRILLWSPGRFRGDFGECVWDEPGARAVMAAYEARGNPIPIDLEHNSNLLANPQYNPSQPPEGGGYTWLRVEPGPGGPALWLDPIQWSAHARAQIESGSRRAISPDWDFDPATGRVVRLKKVSLVQNPGTYGIGLIASAKGGRETTVEEKLKMFVAALRAALTAQDPKAGIEALITEVEGILGGGAGGSSMTPELPPAPAPEPMAAGEGDPLDDEEKLASAIASAFKKLGLAPARAPQAPARAAAPTSQGFSPASVRELVRAELADHSAKASLIASAKGDGRPMTDALAAQIAAMSLSQARAVVAALPRAEPASALASAGASAAPVKVGAHGTAPAASAATGVQARETASIEAIRLAARGRDERILAARANATDEKGQPIVSEDGAYAFSALSQMRPRKPVSA